VSSKKVKSKVPIEMDLIGLMAPSIEAKGTFNFNDWSPTLSQEIADPSGCSVDLPVAITGEASPLI